MYYQDTVLGFFPSATNITEDWSGKTVSFQLRDKIVQIQLTAQKIAKIADAFDMPLYPPFPKRGEDRVTITITARTNGHTDTPERDAAGVIVEILIANVHFPKKK